ncbi:AtzE family amidohydrolase [Bordetella holmesii]|uniref:Amidohydrolase, AtzE family n=2 Tax=Bordetella holmesii TaxID=35814 RepID=A0A158M3Q4_9BORD|nr:AtzE family amidohydrolase [Bordetella holmesii]AHV93425.1 amidohydrolase, AtzE family protein [Bordetella holmesii ATCC 51541]AIT24784.1 amidohydrolase, AtzE family protein [Bordetella holmesii 44057]AMD44076.1 amidase [Bordetella holmesii H558]AMD50383.1 amidase [Bordetella holmesii F627]AOB36185.1 amidase [Bordetella holmesii]
MSSALNIAKQIAAGQRRAVDVLDDTLARVRADSSNAFTEVTLERAYREAAEIDARRARGEALPALAGVPYAVKNLYDIAGVVTLAGGKVNAGNAPAHRDAALITRLRDAGAVLVGALNMDEHAYGFTTENTHFGPCRNPHDPGRIAGGSSGGSAAAVAAGLVPLTLGSDTNGSIRVPASLCGVFGLKPTYGRLPRSGSFPFVYSLDHLGPFAGTASDLALAYDSLQGAWAEDPACAQCQPELSLPALEGRPLRVAILGGYFDEWAGPQARRSVAQAAAALGARDVVEFEGTDQARAAAFIITGAEGGALHRQRLTTHYDDYEPYSRDRLAAGSLIPATWTTQAQRIRRRFRDAVLPWFEHYDVLIAAATPVPATPIGTDTLSIAGQQLPARASMGLLTQPISCIGLPVATAPLWQGQGDTAHLPLGVQLIAAPWREDLCLAAARLLERAGVAYTRKVAA